MTATKKISRRRLLRHTLGAGISLPLFISCQKGSNLVLTLSQKREAFSPVWAVRRIVVQALPLIRV